MIAVHPETNESCGGNRRTAGDHIARLEDCGGLSIDGHVGSAMSCHFDFDHLVRAENERTIEHDKGGANDLTNERKRSNVRANLTYAYNTLFTCQ